MTLQGRTLTHDRGLSLVEVLVLLAVLGIVAAISFAAVRPSFELRAARAVRSMILQARAEAMWTGSPVAVIELPDGRGFVADRLALPACADGKTITTLHLAEFPGVRLVDGLRTGGLYWLPTGGGRTCSGGGVISDTLVLGGPRGSAAVIVSSLGRVRLERRP